MYLCAGEKVDEGTRAMRRRAGVNGGFVPGNSWGEERNEQREARVAHLECTPPELSSVMMWSVLLSKAGLMYFQPASLKMLFVSRAMSTREAPWAIILPQPNALWPTC